MTNRLAARWFFDVVSPFSYLHLSQFERLHPRLEIERDGPISGTVSQHPPPSCGDLVLRLGIEVARLVSLASSSGRTSSAKPGSAWASQL
jgi:hypothetical protein